MTNPPSQHHAAFLLAARIALALSDAKLAAAGISCWEARA